jgi:glycine/D-amino acid oxidase-like deaminating enzyme
MMGISLAPITGQIIAAAISNEPTHFNLTQLHPDRYT